MILVVEIPPVPQIGIIFPFALGRTLDLMHEVGLNFIGTAESIFQRETE